MKTNKIKLYIIIIIPILAQSKTINSGINSYFAKPRFNYSVEKNRIPVGNFRLLRSYGKVTQIMESIDDYVRLHEFHKSDEFTPPENAEFCILYTEKPGGEIKEKYFDSYEEGKDASQGFSETAHKALYIAISDEPIKMKSRLLRTSPRKPLVIRSPRHPRTSTD